MVIVLGRVYTMGRGEFGRLGLDANINQADKLMQIDVLKDIATISARSIVSFAVDTKGLGPSRCTFGACEVRGPA